MSSGSAVMTSEHGHDMTEQAGGRTHARADVGITDDGPRQALTSMSPGYVLSSTVRSAAPVHICRLLHVQRRRHLPLPPASFWLINISEYLADSCPPGNAEQHDRSKWLQGSCP